MLKVDITKRYGNLVNGFRDIKKHPFFEPIDWCALFNRQVTAPFVPTVDGTEDTSHFDQIKGKLFVADSKDKFDDEFKDF